MLKLPWKQNLILWKKINSKPTLNIKKLIKENKKKRFDLQLMAHNIRITRLMKWKKLIKELTSKLTKLEVAKKTQNRPIQERPNRNPQLFQRERRGNEDQTIQPPLQNTVDDEIDE